MEDACVELTYAEKYLLKYYLSTIVLQWYVYCEFIIRDKMQDKQMGSSSYLRINGRGDEFIEEYT